MNAKPRFALLCTAMSFALGGCVSMVTVEKASPQSEGIRYSLPQVFIRVVPAPDGTMTVQKLFLPDPDHEYVINATSYLGKYTLEVKRDESGFLESAAFNADSSGVAKQLATSAAAVRAAEVDAQVAKSNAESAAAKGAADKARAALETADKARKQAQLDLALAKQKLAMLEERQRQPDAPPAIADQVFAAKLAVAEATMKLQAAEDAYQTLVASTAGDGTPRTAANAPGAVSGKAPLPWMLYRAEMTDASVQLRQQYGQPELPAWSIPKKEEGANPISLLPNPIVVRPAKDTKALTVRVIADKQLQGLRPTSLFHEEGKKGVTPLPVLSLQPDRREIQIDFLQEMPAGTYTLDMTLTGGTADKPKDENGTIRIHIAK